MGKGSRRRTRIVNVGIAERMKFIGRKMQLLYLNLQECYNLLTDMLKVVSTETVHEMAAAARLCHVERKVLAALEEVVQLCEDVGIDLGRDEERGNEE